MNEQDLQKLRGYYQALKGQQKVFEDAREYSQLFVEGSPVEVLQDILSSIKVDFPEFISTISTEDFYDHSDDMNRWYKITGIQSLIAMVLGKLKAAIDTSESTPITETRDFSFAREVELSKILERDYSEIQRAFISKCWKSVIILSGGAIEAILTDLILQNSASARSASKAPGETDITKWGLADLINVSVELDLVSSGIEKLSHSVRDYRNLIHPGNEIRQQLTFDAEEAKIALEVLHILHRDLSA